MKKFIVCMIIVCVLAVGFAGCSAPLESDTDETLLEDPATETEQTTVPDQDEITISLVYDALPEKESFLKERYQQFCAVPLGSTFAEAEDTYGEKLVSSDAYSESCFVMFTFRDGKLIEKYQIGLVSSIGKTYEVSKSIYEKVQLDMTYEEVKAITGGEAALNSERYTEGLVETWYHWKVDGKWASLKFENGILKYKEYEEK